MILCDSSAIIALLNRQDKYHKSCVAAIQDSRLPLVTTWACVTEAMYFLDIRVGAPGQEELRSYLEDEIISLHIGSREEARRIYALMRQYDYMDFADGSLVAAAETLNARKVFTLDSHFYSYRIGDKRHFEVLPQGVF